MLVILSIGLPNSQILPLLVLSNFLLERIDEFSEGHIQLLATLQNRIWRRNLPISLHLDLDLLFERVRLLVAREADAGVLEQLEAQAVAEGVILILYRHRPLKPLPRIVLVGDPKK